MAGKRPYVDPRIRTRSFIEEQLVRVMEKCWEQERTERSSIFAVVQLLREAKADAITKGEFKLKPPSLSIT